MPAAVPSGHLHVGAASPAKGLGTSNPMLIKDCIQSLNDFPKVVLRLLPCISGCSRLRRRVCAYRMRKLCRITGVGGGRE